MYARLLVLTVVVVAGSAGVTLASSIPGPFPPRIIETFDSYPDGFELGAVYPTLGPAQYGATVTSSQDLYPGIQGGAAEFEPVLTMSGATHRIENEELTLLTPDLFGPLVFRADIYDDGVTEGQRIVVDVRYQIPGSGAQNVIRMGTPFPGFPFAHMQAATAFNPLPGWQPFSLPEEMNERSEIGPGWHRYSAVITMTELIYSLDLHRDGTIDAVDVVPAILHPIGFNEMRFGKMGFSPEPAMIAVDNLIFMAVPEPGAAAIAATVGLSVGALGRRRRR